MLALFLGLTFVGRASAQSVVQARALWHVDSLISPLYQVRSVILVQDSVLWITDGGTGVHRLSTTGQYLGPVGREGAGPGEHRWPWLLFPVASQRVGLFDRRLLRINYYGADGRYLSSSPLQVVEGVSGRLSGIGYIDASMRVWTDNYPSADARANEQRSYVWDVGVNGFPNDTIIRFAGPESIVLRGDGTSSRIDAPFQRRPFVIFSGTRILVGNSGTDTVLAYDGRGSPVARQGTKVPIVPKRVSASARQVYVERQRKKYFDELERQHYGPELRQSFATRFDLLMGMVKYPATWERYDLMIQDNEGNLWFLLPSFESNWRRTWFEVSPAGHLLRRVSVPHAADVMCAVIDHGVLYAGEWNEEELRGGVGAYALTQ